MAYQPLLVIQCQIPFYISLYNDCWHGFWVRSWWPRVLWQAVMLWLVNRGIAVRGVGRSKRCVTGRRPFDMRTTWSDLDCQSRESRVERGIRSRREAFVSSLMIRLARGCKRKYPRARGGRYGTRRSPLSEYMSLSISQTYNKLCGPSRIKWERPIFIKKCV